MNNKAVYIIYFEGTKSYVTWSRIGSVSAIMKGNFDKVEVRNVTWDNIEEIQDEIHIVRPEFILLYIKFKTYKIAQAFLDKLSDNNIHICACHNLPSGFPKEVLENNQKIDSLIVGEEDHTAVELCRCILESRSLEDCKGIMYRYNNNIIKNDARELENDLDKLPFADRKSFPTDKKFFHIIGSRGCMGNCSFCKREELYKDDKKSKQRFRSISNIINEIDILVEEFECKYIGFSDSTFCGLDNAGNGYQRLQELYEKLSAKKYRIEFFINLRAEQINEKSMYWLKKLNTIGLSMIFLGIESFSNEDLKLYNKIARVEDNVNAIQLIKDHIKNENYKLKFDYGFINFNSYSSIEKIRNNIEILYKSGLDLSPDIVLSKINLNYGTSLYHREIQDELCIHSINLYSKSVPYSYKDVRVAELYKNLQHAFLNYPIKLYDGFISLLNRYIYFYGNDELATNIYQLYSEIMVNQSRYTYMVFVKELNSMQSIESLNSEDNQKELITALMDLQKLFYIKYNRVTAQLKKINQLSYY